MDNQGIALHLTMKLVDAMGSKFTVALHELKGSGVVDPTQAGKYIVSYYHAVLSELNAVNKPDDHS